MSLICMLSREMATAQVLLFITSPFQRRRHFAGMLAYVDIDLINYHLYGNENHK